MKSLLHLSLVASRAWCGNLPIRTESRDLGPEYIVENPTSSSQDGRIPTSYESAVMGRRILALTPLGTLSTNFPAASDAEASDHRPSDTDGLPIGLLDYVADCDPDNDIGNPTILAIKIATSFKNVRDGNNNVSLSLHWTPPYPPDSRIEFESSWLKTFLSYMPWVTPSPDEKEQQALRATMTRSKYSAANLPRFSLIGHLEPIPDAGRDSKVAKCFVHTHPDARYWLPGNKIHASEFVRLVVTHVYWIGGFGDRAYIGWIPVEEWNKVTREEWGSIRLPGEKKGWKEWAWVEDVLSLEL